MADTRWRFLNVVIMDVEADLTKINPVLDIAVDWVRYAPQCWMLWTTSNAKVWHARLKPHLGANGGVLITEIDLSEPGENYSGFMRKLVWDWIERHR